jgi:hypothetical protein
MNSLPTATDTGNTMAVAKPEVVEPRALVEIPTAMCVYGVAQFDGLIADIRPTPQTQAGRYVVYFRFGGRHLVTDVGRSRHRVCRVRQPDSAGMIVGISTVSVLEQELLLFPVL